MKRITYIIILLLCIPLLMQGAEMTQRQAMDKARTFLQQKLQNGPAQMRRASQHLVMQPVEMAIPSLYAFNAEGGGYVIVSGDDRVETILGYSLDGCFDEADMPDNMRAWLQGYSRQAEMVRQGQMRTGRRAAAARSRIEPLVKTQWSQRAPYNQECPIDINTNMLSATGCVATSMSQILNYWQWPKQNLEGFTTDGGEVVPVTIFDWDHLLPTYTEGNYTEEEAKAVAHLMRWTGWSVDMNYSTSMSGSATATIERALRDCFGYDKNVHWLSQVDYSLEEWEDILYAELANSRPIIYNGYNSNMEGHSFICDGYDGDGMFHFNWGWAGKFDGFFQILELNPGGSDVGGSLANPCWTDFHDVVVGIQPPTDDPAIAYLPPTESNVSMYVYGDSELTRADTHAAFPEFSILRYFTTAHTVNTKDPYRYALLKDGQIHCLLKGLQDCMQAVAGLITLNRFTCQLPDTISDGEYRLVAMENNDREPSLKDIVRGSDRFHIQVTVDGTKLHLRPSQGEAHLKLSNPEYVMNEDGETVRTLTFTVENQGEEEFFGHLFIYKPGYFWTYERVWLKPHETCRTTFYRRTNLNPISLRRDDPISVYADLFFHEWVYGSEYDARPVKLGNMTISGDRIDNERKIIKGNAVVPVFTLTNLSDIDYEGSTNVRVYNAETGESVIINSLTWQVAAGSSFSASKENLVKVGDWKKIFFEFRYENRNAVWESVCSDIYTIAAVITSITPDNMVTVHDDTDEFITPEDATVIYMERAQVKRVKPNSNPNTMYFVSNTSIEGLENSIVIDENKESARPVIFDTRYDMGFKHEDVPIYESELSGIVHTFTPEETDCWLPLALFSTTSYTETIVDVNTGEDLSSKFKFYDVSVSEKEDAGFSAGEMHVEAKKCHGGFNLLRVDPSVAGKTVMIAGDTKVHILSTSVCFPVNGGFNYCHQTLDNIYVLEGNSFVWHEHCELKPFTIYLMIDKRSEVQYPKSFTIVNDDEATGIVDNNREPITNNRYYDLQGRRLSVPSASSVNSVLPKGVYIKGGKKIIIK